MIPHSLRLRNFMSYGDVAVEVDFSGLHLACLSGGNGHGKSALLDALTWALWGYSRARREDDLVRQGATDMDVELCFQVGGGHYRVLRKRAIRGGTSKASLELQVQGEAGYTSITGSTIAETQTRLLDILKLGYETFINSSFLLQGRADEFTVKPPSQRKEVLGQILGLDRYDELAERARARYKALELETRGLKEAMAMVEDDLARRDTLREELEGLARDHELAMAALGAAESALRAVQAERQSLETVERSAAAAEQSIAGLRAEIATLQERHDTATAAIDQAGKLLADEARITAGIAELGSVRAEIEEMGGRAGRVMELQPAVERHRQEIETLAAALRTTIQCAAEEALAFERKAADLPALARQAELCAAAEARIPPVEAERAQVAGELQDRRHEAALLEGETARLRAEMEPLRERLRLLKERGATCPVCGAPMSDGERTRVYEQFKADGLAKQAQCKANETLLGDLRWRIDELERRDGELVKVLAELTKQARDSGRAGQLVAEATAAQAAAQEARARGEEAARSVAAGDFAHEARQRLAAAQAAVSAVGYDRERHAMLRDRAAELAPLEASAAALATARERKSAAKVALGEVEADLGRRGAELTAAEQTLDDLRRTLTRLPEIEARLHDSEAAVAERRRAADGIDRLAVAKREVLRLLDEQEEKLQQQRLDLARLERDAGAYSELSRAFGKKGIQAMIIDGALPELEREANAILTRMSDGTLGVQFKTQTLGSRGDMLETLEIQISDASGTRPYEMFSGGEAFRANFAIRVALSRLLATRAGARLQLLVIDEGFGTQDSEGRERLVEAINSIAADFEKIFVITHIDELRDAFSARIEVVKGPDGSRVSLAAY